MSEESNVQSLIVSIYDAALEPEAWPEFLRAYRLRAGADSGVALAAHDDRVQAGSILFSDGIDQTSQDAYNAYYHKTNTYLQRGIHLFKSGRVIRGEQMCPDSYLLTSEFYNDYLRRQDIRYTLGTCIEHGTGRGSHLGLCRSGRDGTFTEEHVQLASLVSPHLQRAIRLHQRVADLRNRFNTLTACLNQLPCAMIVVDGAGKIHEANQSALELCRRADGLRIRNEVLSALSAGDAEKLNRNISACCKAAEGGPRVPSMGQSIHRATAIDPWFVAFFPLRTTTREGFTQNLCLLLIHDPSTRAGTPPEILQEWHGLTPAEARVASLLASGFSVDQIAHQLRIKSDSVRTHLKRAYIKTGTTTQAELVMVVLSGGWSWKQSKPKTKS